MYKMIGNLPDRDMSMLEERIKRASKSRPAMSAPAPPEPEPAPVAPPPVQNTGLPRPGSTSNRNAPSGLRRFGAPASSSIPSSNPVESRLPQRGSPSHSSHGRDRPISGAFTLDFDKIESGAMDGSIRAPQLVNHNLDAIFNDDPVKLPPTLIGRGHSR